MNYSALEDVKLIRDAASEFSKEKILPYVKQWDEEQHFPRELFREMGEMGFMGILVPETYGGSGMGYDEYIAVIDEISQVDPSIGLSVAAHNSLCTNHILSFGSEEQKEKYLPGLANGTLLGAWGLTEVGTGSDALGMDTVGKRDGDYWVINGTKNFITHAISGDVSVVLVRTGDKGDAHGITAFIIEMDTPGFSHGRKEDKLGMRASETGELIFTDCRIPDANRLGEIGEGFIQAMKILDGGRISIGALALGIARGAYKASLKYAKEREQFGKAIAQFQSIAFKLADMATEIELGETLLYKCAWLKNNDKSVTVESAMAKSFMSESCVRIATDAIQIHGGYGYTKDFPVEKYFRDSKLCTIGEGTTEIQKLVISRNILK